MILFKIYLIGDIMKLMFLSIILLVGSFLNAGTTKPLTQSDFLYQFNNTGGYPMKDEYCVLKSLKDRENIARNVNDFIKNGTATARREDIGKSLVISYQGDTLIFLDTKKKCLDTIKNLNFMWNLQNKYK